jgi:hypothetical protein
LERGSAMTRATFVIFLPKLSSFIDWCYTQVNYTGSWKPLVVRFVLDQQAELDFFHSASSLKQKVADRHVAPLGHIILIPSQPVFALSP